MTNEKEFILSCPLPISDYPQILLADGGGGRRMHGLIKNLIAPGLDDPLLQTQHDGAVFDVNGTRLAFTTDSHVVKPLFFPGGDIGTLAVNGTVNDLAVCGARPLYLSCGLILEEGLSTETLWRVMSSMNAAAAKANVHVVTGDTKVVERGNADGMFINTAGVGVVEHLLKIAPSSIHEGDVVILSGDIGRHGMAVMSQRESLGFESSIKSDCAPIAGQILALLDAGVQVRCLRDLTRGGLAAAMVEISAAAGLRLVLEESAIQVRDDVRNACEILGLDPLLVANEGRFATFVARGEAERTLEILRLGNPEQEPAMIGTVRGSHTGGLVSLRTRIGAERILDLPAGEELPRIC